MIQTFLTFNITVYTCLMSFIYLFILKFELKIIIMINKILFKFLTSCSANRKLRLFLEYQKAVCV